jgi:hypothetical protein
LKLFLLFDFIQIKTGAVFLADFFKYSNLSISSFSHKHFKKSFNAQGLCGKLIKKYLFSHSNFILLSFSSGNLSKSKFHQLIIKTIVFHFILFFKSFNASVDKAQAGSTIIHSSLK